MNRLTFLKRLGALAVTAMVAEPIIEALAAPVINETNKKIFFHITHNGIEHTYWYYAEDLLNMREFQLKSERKMFGYE